MATYKKKLLDSKGNVILPYTRSECVYMANNTTLENRIAALEKTVADHYDAFTTYKTNLGSGAIKVGSAGFADESRILTSLRSGTTVTTNRFIFDSIVGNDTKLFIWSINRQCSLNLSV